jgi:hypothetical protein
LLKIRHMSTLARSCNQSDKRTDQCTLLDSEDENVYERAFELTDGMHQIQVVRLLLLRLEYLLERRKREYVYVYTSSNMYA